MMEDESGARSSSNLDPEIEEKLTRAIRDVLGDSPEEISIKFNENAPLGPGGIRSADGSWDGNLYKYRY